MAESAEILMRLIGSEVFGIPLTMPAGTVMTDELLSRVFDLAKAHDVVPVISSALVKNNLLFGSAFEGLYRKQMYDAVLKSENQSFALDKISEIFEKAQIRYIPLKGSVIKALYPESWLRTGCDIDILINKEDLFVASEILHNELGFVRQKDGGYDVSFINSENICLELHYTLMDRKKSEYFGGVLDNVWDYAESENGGCRYKLNDEMFYFYHIAHMAKHFRNGGCGIRFFIDLWLIEKSKDYYTHRLKILLKKGNLLEFANQSKALCEVWFLQKNHTETTALMEDYIFSGGSFGSEQTKATVNKTQGEVRFAFSRIFAPYNYLKEIYPVLKKYKFLLPFFEIVRVFSYLFGKKKGVRERYITGMRNVPDEKASKMKILFKRLKL